MSRTAAVAHSRTVVRVLLAGFMVFAGVAHFVAHDAFLGQVPTWLPARSAIVWISGVIEIVLGIALLAAPRHRRHQVGWALALFLVAVFPGNVYQAVAATDAFGIDTPAVRWGRLALQPALILIALWSTGAWPRADRLPGDTTTRPPGGGPPAHRQPGPRRRR